MSDPYVALGEQLFAAARRQEGSLRRTDSEPWRYRRLRIAVVVLVLLLAGATIALAASELLSGSPVKPHEPLNARVGEGIPAPGGSLLLALRVPDPQGGPPWGMRIVHTTRGEVCVQIGRVQNGQLGELGIDGAFKDDGRFHPLPPDVLSTEGPASSKVLCVLSGQILTGRLTALERNALRTPYGGTPPTGDLREVSFGLLGPHALTITYRARPGSRTVPLTPDAGAYLFVKGAKRPSEEGSIGSGYASTTKHRPSPLGVVTAITYRFGDLECSDGTGAKITRQCPTERSLPASWRNPTRSLHRPLRITLEIRHSLIYSAELEFSAPYAVTSAHEIYEVIQPSPSGCAAGGSGLPLERDIKQGQMIRVKLIGLFQFANRCGPAQEIQVRFINPEGPSAASPHESVIIASTTITEPQGDSPAPIPAPSQKNSRP